MNATLNDPRYADGHSTLESPSCRHLTFRLAWRLRIFWLEARRRTAMDAVTYFPEVLPLEPTHLDPALLGAFSAATLWVLFHGAFAFCWLTAGLV